MTTKGASPLKRKLEELSEDELGPRKKLQPYIQHETYWILDGNVLLQIDGVRFKLHKSRLASVSPWFKTLFDRRAGILQADIFSHQDEIEPVVLNSEFVDGLDLFYLDFRNVNAKDFVNLLKCMDNAISYLDNPPDFPTIDSILWVAHFFKIDSYAIPLERMVQKMFSDRPVDIGPTVTPYALEALELGRQAPALKNIIRRAFYELVRSPPQTLDEVGRKDLELLMKVQREIATTWESIIAIAEPKCNESKCLKKRAPNSAAALRKAHPFDPIYAIKLLLIQDWSSIGFCPPRENKAVADLTLARSRFWALLKIWIGIAD